ncbi:MAG: BatD family protein [Gammaproteobacteria bacterium]|nr:BatD family protein [Gammaproteobacteria bacterium]
MSTATKLSRTLTALLLLLFCASVMAQQNYPGYPYRPPYPYPPQGQQPGYAPQGQQPGYAPQARPPYAQQQPWQQPTAPAKAAAAPPRVELQLSTTRGYVQQTILLTLDLISDHNLRSVDIRPPSASSLVFTRLEGPTSSSHDSGGKRSFVNRYRYAVTPLQEGTLRLPALEIDASGEDGRRFQLQTDSRQVLQILPMNPDLTPWLPLHGLTIQSFLRNDEQLEAGKPLTLVVDISAVGATGSQLPSFEQHLKQNSEFNVYREQSEADGVVSSDGRYLLGRRTESFTLVPQTGGKLLIPALQLNWWNVDTGTAHTESVPIRQLVVKGEQRIAEDRIPDLFPGASSLLLWVPLVGLFSLTIGFWVLSWLRKKRFAQVVEEELVAATGFGIHRFRKFLNWLAPIRRLQKVRQIFVRSLPRSFRLWFCVRVVEGEDDPEIWSYMLKFLSNKHLQIPPQLPLKRLGEQLSGVHSRADRAQMQALMGELDNALYGGGAIDFAEWKRRFRAQLRPALLPFQRRQPRPAKSTATRLPKLNPDF